uniref:Uncharacterized protein n=1 Tax=Rhizophora mucronata TaxID=61149 RepID=A0A2P2P1I1_RHIMU
MSVNLVDLHVLELQLSMLSVPSISSVLPKCSHRP